MTRLLSPTLPPSTVASNARRERCGHAPDAPCSGGQRETEERRHAPRSAPRRPTFWLQVSLMCLAFLQPAGIPAAEAPPPSADVARSDAARLRMLTDQLRGALARPDQASAHEQRLIDLLSSERSPEVRELACLQLRMIGTATAVPSLGGLLSDPQLAPAARFALQTIPDAAATRALTNALGSVSGARQLGIINSLGERRDPGAVPALTALLATPEAATRNAALAALGKTGGEPALRCLLAVATRLDPAFGEIEDLPEVPLPADATNTIDPLILTDALLLGADDVAGSGAIGLASEVYRRVYVSPAAPRHCRVAALHGALRAAPSIAMPVVLGTLQVEDPAVQGIGLSLARQFTPEAVGMALAQLGDMTPTGQAALIRILAEREDPALGPRFLELTRSKAPAVRQAAIRALAGVEADAGAVQRLAEIAATTDPATAQAARDTLPRLHGYEVETAIREGALGAVADLRVELIHAIADRRMSAAVPTLLEAATTSNDAVRIAALEALAFLAEPAHYPLLVEFLRAAESTEERVAALAALRRVGERIEDRDQCARLLAPVYDEAGTPLKLEVLDLLGVLGGNTALRLVANTAAQESNRRLRGRAIEVLAAWPDAAAIQHLFAVANSAADTGSRVLALQGYLRLLGLPTERPLSETARLHRLAIAVAKTPEDYGRILAGLARLPSVEALDTVEPFLADEAVRADAVRAILAIGPGTVGDAPERTGQALRRASSRCDSEDLKKTVDALLDRLATPDGVIRAWLLSGPYTGRGNLLEQSFVPETRLNEVAWEPLIAADGEVSFEGRFPETANVAYLRVVLRVAKPTKARLRVETGGAAKIWLAGQAVRPADPPPEAATESLVIDVDLRAGNNPMLAKVTRGAKPWRFTARLTDREDKPLTELRTGVE